MPFQPGNSGYPEGQRRAKLFTEALRTEIAAAGDDHKAASAYEARGKPLRLASAHEGFASMGSSWKGVQQTLRLVAWIQSD